MHRIQQPFCRSITPSRFSNRIACAAVAAFVALSAKPASTAPIELKLAFFASEQGEVYRAGIKPFVDAVNRDGQGLLAIKVYPDGALGPLAQLPRLVLDGGTDIAWIVPGQTPYRFPDNELLELPGLFRDTREGTLVYTRLVAARALRGYQDYFVIGAYTSAPTIIHSRKPIGSLADLAGQKLRANNSIEAEVLDRLGAKPTVLSASKLAGAVNGGALDGAALSPGGLFDFGVSQVTNNHYLLYGGVAPLALLMSRKKFESLPVAAQDIIRKHSGGPAADAWIALFGASEMRHLETLKSNSGRQVVTPTAADQQTAQNVFHSVIESWTAKDPHNRALLNMIEAEVAAIRSAK